MDLQQAADTITHAAQQFEEGAKKPVNLMPVIEVLRGYAVSRHAPETEALLMRAVNLGALYQLVGGDKQVFWRRATGVYVIGLRRRRLSFRANLHLYGCMYLNWAMALLGSGNNSLAFSYAEMALGYLDPSQSMLVAKAQLIAALSARRKDYAQKALQTFTGNGQARQLNDLAVLCQEVLRSRWSDFWGLWFYSKHKHLAPSHMVRL